MEDFVLGVGFHEYYCRRGLYDQLQPNASPYEQARAVCVDDIVLWRWRAIYRDFNASESHKVTVIVESITKALQTLYERRLHMTFHDAQVADFDRAVYTLIENHIVTLHLKSTSAVENSRTMLYIQEALKYPLLPWFQLSFMYKAKEESPFILLRSCTTRHINAFQQAIPENLDDCWTVIDCLRMMFVSRICQLAETIGHHIFNSPDELEKMSMVFLRFAFVFRKYLESGNASHEMPRVTAGLIDKRRHGVAYLRWRLSNPMGFPPDCKCAMSVQEKEMRASFHWRQGAGVAQQDYRRKVMDGFQKLEQNGIGAACLAFDKLNFAEQALPP